MPQVEKEKLVEQLQTKVSDLERFIEFIQMKQPDDLDLPKLPKEANKSKSFKFFFWSLFYLTLNSFLFFILNW